MFLFFDGVSEGSLKTLEDNQVYIVKFKDAFAINNLLINAEILTPLSDSDAFITTPRGTTWRNIKITLEQDEEHCEISIGSETHSYKYNNPKLGNGVFLDKRTKKPNKLWKLLMEFAKNSGNIRWQKGGYTKDGPLSAYSPDATDYDEQQPLQVKRNKNNPQIKQKIKDIQRLRDALQQIFSDVKGDPIPCQDGIYQPIFEIEYRVDMPQ